MQPNLAISAVLSLLSASIYGFVGIRLRRRDLSSGSAQRAWDGFTVWWFGLALTTVTSGLLNLVGAFGLTSLSFYIGITYINLLFVCVALWGLLGYLLYLFTGNSRWFVIVTLFYLAYFLALVYTITASDPIGVQLTSWNIRLIYRIPLTGSFVEFLVILLVFPQILCGLAYFTLYFRVREPTRKYRILLVSWSIVIWFLSAFLASIAGGTNGDAWQVSSRLIGAAASLGVLLAYFPPERVKRRFGVAALADEAYAPKRRIR